MGSELECRKCGALAVNRDFCSCGEYLAWELTTLPAATPAPEPAVYRPPAPAVARPSTLLTLRDPAREDDPSAAVSVSVVPGAEVAILATVRNQSQIVDTFDVRVDGLPEAWSTVSPATVFLNPWGTSGDYERQMRVRLHPPRAPASEARAWPLTVVARSRSLGADVAWVQATLIVQPFQSTVMYVGPERRRGRRHASFDVVVENHGNSPMEIVIGAQDTEERCPVTVAPERRMVPVGETVAAVVRVGVPHPVIFGRPVDHHLDVTHRATGVDSEPVPQRVTFRQKPWLPWWVPPVVVLLALFMAAMLLLRREHEVPKLEGDTMEEALVVLEKRHLKLGRVMHDTAPKGVSLDTIIRQEPAAGDDIVKGESVNITLAAPPKTGHVPPVQGRSLAEAADALTAANFGYNPQPSSAGNDWVVIRQHPTPGSRHAHGTPVTLAVENRSAAAMPAPAATPAAATTPAPAATPTAAATKAPTGAAKPAAKGKPATAKTSNASKPAATAAPLPPLPAEFVFAGAASGQLYRWTSPDAKAAALTSPKYRFETPTKTGDGYVAVQRSDAGRRLVRISADGKTVDPIAEGDYHRPAYSPDRDLLAAIFDDDRGGPAGAGKLCVMDPQDTGTTACAPGPADGRRLGRPTWAPDGRAVLVLAAGADGNYDELLSYAATGGDAKRWAAPVSVYRGPSIKSAVWVGNDRIALLLADRPTAPAHLRLLARHSHGKFKRVKDFPTLTGYELAATGHHLALRRGKAATGDGAMVLLDADRAKPRIRGLASGSNPAWAG